MILSFNARENNYKGKEVIKWYEQIEKSERSRKIIDILYAHILSNQHTIKYEIRRNQI
jgi:hypothetical protein